MKNSGMIKKIIQEEYKKIAIEGSGCGCGCESSEEVSKSIGYSDDDIAIGGGANLGLGCGNPVALSKIKKGDTVLDLGCGAGFDCFLASKKVGEDGKIIGVDMTEEMINKARLNAKKIGVKNVSFILSEIEKLPVQDDSIDVIITNCVINLTPNKTETFKEAYRVLKRGGRMYVSDIVLLKELSRQQKEDKNLLAGCVAGALLKEDYLEKIKKTGFNVRILSENREISKQQYRGIALESLMVELVK